MDSLRWILLGVGILIVAGVYLWSRRPPQSQRVEPRLDAETPPEPGDFDVGGETALESETFSQVDPAAAEPAPREWPDAVDRELEELSAAIQEERRGGARTEPAPPGTVEKIIVFYLIAPRGEPFTGPDMDRAFTELGLEYGDMQIYHRMAPGSFRRPVFSIANLTEPGTFDPATLGSFTTPGLSLFLQLPAPIDSLKAFDDLDETAHKLATRLNGELRDETRSPLSRQRIDNLRQEVAEFERQQKLKPAGR